MSISGEQSPQLAGDWEVVPIADDDRQRFMGFLSGDFDHNKDYALNALGILAAGQAYFEQNNGVDEITVISNHPAGKWPLVSKQFKVCTEFIGWNIRTRPLEEAAQAGELVVVHGDLPSPEETLALPGLESLRRRLIDDAKRRSWDGVAYVGSKRHQAGSALSIGFAEPYTGRRLEAEYSMDVLKERYGYPPPPPPPRKGGGGWNVI